MSEFLNYELRKIHPNSNEYEIRITLLQDAEFASELDRTPKIKHDIVHSAKKMIQERYPHLKVSVVKILIGGMVMASIPLTGETTTAHASQTTEASSYFYTVSKGDSLWTISMKYNVSVNDVKRANQLNSDMIQLNQRLIIPKAFHIVLSGQSLSVLAKQYGTSVQALKEVNHLRSDIIKVGQMLIIPMLMDVPQQNPSIYTIVSGDSLSVIAKRFGTTVEAIKTENNLTSDILRIGQTLTIPTAANNTVEIQKSYTVVQGDSLSVIAKRFGTTVEAIKTENNLTSDILRIGQTLTIPTVANNTVEIQNSYTVVQGDSLSVIAKRFGTTVEAIKTENNLATDILRIGQVLSIPKNTTHTPHPIEEVRTTFTYTVVSGDYLSSIAKRFNVTIDAIRKANYLQSDMLRIGQLLTIPDGLNAPIASTTKSISYVIHTVVSGDNIWDLSIRYGVPQAEILQANHLSASSMLKIGQKLTIPVHHIPTKPVISAKHGEYLDWWTEAQYVFSIGKTAKVTDFTTGKSFYIKRTIGANHADSETVSVNDTNIAKAIWGGFSWTPRAVIIEVDGRKLAGSMSFMPHERQYITNNGITGHFDVYFANSTRHVDGKADLKHQAQVEKAAGLR